MTKVNSLILIFLVSVIFTISAALLFPGIEEPGNADDITMDSLEIGRQGGVVLQIVKEITEPYWSFTDKNIECPMLPVNSDGEDQNEVMTAKIIIDV